MVDQRVFQTLLIHKALVLPFYKVIQARPLETVIQTGAHYNSQAAVFCLIGTNLLVSGQEILFKNAIFHRIQK